MTAAFDALEALEVASQGAPFLRLLLGGGSGDLDLHVAVVGPDPAGGTGQRRLEHAAGHVGEVPDVPSGNGSRPDTTVPTVRVPATAAVLASCSDPPVTATAASPAVLAIRASVRAAPRGSQQGEQCPRPPLNDGRPGRDAGERDRPLRPENGSS